MERIEIFESRTKNVFWAIGVVGVGLFFLISSTFEGVNQGSQNISIGLGIILLLGSLFFVYDAFKKKLTARITDDGIWTRSFDKTVAWDEIESVLIENGMLILELISVDRSFPDSSKISKALLKRSLVMLSTSNVQIPQLYEFIEERFGEH